MRFLLALALDAYTLVIFGAVFASWMRLPPSHPIAGRVLALTEPLLRPIRERLPTLAGLDFSPLVLLVAVRIVRGIVLG